MMNIYVDGAGAPFKNQIGFIAIVFEDGSKEEVIPIFKGVTNNEAEYLAVREGLKLAKDGDTIFTDSQLVVGHLVSNWDVNAKNLIPLYNECVKISDTKAVTLQWIPRVENLAGKLLEKSKDRSPFKKDYEDVGQIILDKIRPVLINFSKDAVWNSFWQFGIDIDRPLFKDMKLFWLCYWTDEQQKEFEELLKEKKLLRKDEYLAMTFKDPTNTKLRIVKINEKY